MRLSVFFLFIAVSFAQQPPPESAKPPRPPAPKNLKLLKPEGLLETMRSYRVALGMQCTGCHVKGDFASDENPHKEIARTMIVMTREINAKFEGDHTHVTCWTCHRGAEHPATTAPAEAASPAGAPAAGTPPEPPAPPVAPAK